MVIDILKIIFYNYFGFVFWVITVDSHGIYPEYSGDLDVEGSVSLNLYDDSVVIHYDVTGVDAACASGPTEGNYYNTRK
jgi:hypothetical protein